VLGGYMATIQQLKKKGRFGDTELVHMSKPEVNALMRLATAHGKKLTNNPDTGLKEAFSLGDLNPFKSDSPINPGNVLKGVKGVFDTLSGKDAQDAALRAAALQGSATDRATAENMRQFDIGQTNLAPWLQSGKGALTAQQNLMGLNGTVDTAAELAKDPGYQFRLAQGQKSFDSSSLASRAGFGSGGAFKAANDYNQGNASQEYSNRLNQLAGLSGTGQSTGNQMAGMGANYANNQGNLWTNNANAQGAAGMAGANARASGLMNVINLGAKVFGGM
jgi:hypothetical protein